METPVLTTSRSGSATLPLSSGFPSRREFTLDLPGAASWTRGWMAASFADPRRVLNVVLAFIALILCLPVMLVIAVVIKLTSPGPVIYRQQRIGMDRRWHRSPCPRSIHRRGDDLGGRPFTIYKFRTMRHTDDKAQVWAKANDSRVTRVGRFLRTTRLDEIPQFYNVLRGDMNIVGPRPEQPRIFSELRNEIDSYAVRQRVLPGITGLAQVQLCYDTSVDDVRKKVRVDLEYVERCSAALDLQILLRTIPVVLFRRGAH